MFCMGNWIMYKPKTQPSNTNFFTAFFFHHLHPLASICHLFCCFCFPKGASSQRNEMFWADARRPRVHLFYGPFLQAYPSGLLQIEIPFSSGVAVWISNLKTSPSITFMFSLIFKRPSDLETQVLFVKAIKAHMLGFKAFQSLHHWFEGGFSS